jgi:tetratricopeptide (TPR) repeat protein
MPVFLRTAVATMTRYFRFLALAVVLSTTLGCGSKPDPEVERRRQEERAAEHRAAYTEGLANLEAGSYDAAVTAFEKAHTLDPADTETAEWLGRARAMKQKHVTEQYEKAMTAGREALAAGKQRGARTAFAEALRWKPNDPDATTAHSGTETPALVEQGKEQLETKQFADATRTFLAAARKVPADNAVKELLKQAQEARRAEVRDEYEKAMTTGRAAMAAKNYAGAIQSFATAENLVPGGSAALAEKQEARRVEIQFEYEKAMAAGRAAMATKNYLAASQSFTAAEKLIPGDKTALAEKLSADYEHHMRRGQDAQLANRHAEAITEFETATRLNPQDEHAKALLATARQAKVNADRAQYTQVLTDAKTAMATKRYRDASRLAKQAEGIIVDHTEASQVRRDAERVIAEYDQWISKSRTAIQKKKYDEAITAADEALRLMPGETEPVLLRSEATRKKLESGKK